MDVPGGEVPSGILFFGKLLAKKGKGTVMYRQGSPLGDKRQSVGIIKGFRNSPDKCRGITTAMLASIVHVPILLTFPNTLILHHLNSIVLLLQ